MDLHDTKKYITKNKCVINVIFNYKRMRINININLILSMLRSVLFTFQKHI